MATRTPIWDDDRLRQLLAVRDIDPSYADDAWEGLDPKAQGWSDGTYACWVVNRVNSLEWPRWRDGRVEFDVEPKEPEDFVTATMHVGFLSLEETPEMLARLHVPDMEFLYEIARSKISTTNEFIQPINATTHRVAQWPDRSTE